MQNQINNYLVSGWYDIQDYKDGKKADETTLIQGPCCNYAMGYFEGYHYCDFFDYVSSKQVTNEELSVNA